eukprot:265277-Pelagomonas_calceolata.AAC.1
MPSVGERRGKGHMATSPIQRTRASVLKTAHYHDVTHQQTKHFRQADTSLANPRTSDWKILLEEPYPSVEKKLLAVKTMDTNLNISLLPHVDKKISNAFRILPCMSLTTKRNTLQYCTGTA